MSISQLLQEATIWLAWSGLGLGLMTIVAFLFNWGVKFRLVGTAIFTLLLSGSCWAFNESYTPPRTFEGAMYTPVVFDNGGNLVVAQVQADFPSEAIEPSLQQLSENLKGGGRNGAKITVRIRKIEDHSPGISTPIILGEAIRDSLTNTTTIQPKEKISEINRVNKIEITNAANEKEDIVSSQEIKDQSPEIFPNETNEDSPELPELLKIT